MNARLISIICVHDLFTFLSLPLECVQVPYAILLATLKHVVTLLHSCGISDGDFSGSLELAADPRGRGNQPTPAAAEPLRPPSRRRRGRRQRRSAIGCILF